VPFFVLASLMLSMEKIRKGGTGWSRWAASMLSVTALVPRKHLLRGNTLFPHELLLVSAVLSRRWVGVCGSPFAWPRAKRAACSLPGCAGSAVYCSSRDQAAGHTIEAERAGLQTFSSPEQLWQAHPCGSREDRPWDTRLRSRWDRR